MQSSKTSDFDLSKGLLKLSKGQWEVLVMVKHECGACHLVRCRLHPVQAAVQAAQASAQPVQPPRCLRELLCQRAHLWSALGPMHSKLRSRLTHERARKLIHGRCNSKCMESAQADLASSLLLFKEGDLEETLSECGFIG